jgi:hypothetical protein
MLAVSARPEATAAFKDGRVCPERLKCWRLKKQLTINRENISIVQNEIPDQSFSCPTHNQMGYVIRQGETISLK